ncbi:hypothetical protein Tco_0511594 [Tanacetum coccineum]
MLDYPSYRNLPYGMFLACLYRHVMEAYPHLDNGIYDIARPSHQYDDDDDDEICRKHLVQVTPVYYTYLNSLDPLNYQNYQMPSAPIEPMTTLLNDNRLAQPNCNK